MAITTDPHDQGRVVEAVAGHHETREQRHFKERLAVWLFISGDAVFLLMELFYWFYLRALNTDGMWRGAACSKANPCTDGLGNPITHEIAKATPWYTVSIAVLVVHRRRLRMGVGAIGPAPSRSGARSAGAAARACRPGRCDRGAVRPVRGPAVHHHRRGVRIDLRVLHGFDAGPPASCSAFIVTGLWTRARRGRYDGGHWYQVRIIRIFAVWLAVSTCILAIVMIAFS